MKNLLFLLVLGLIVSSCTKEEPLIKKEESSITIEEFESNTTIVIVDF